MDSIRLEWTLPKDYDEMTESDWDDLAEQALNDVEAAVATINSEEETT